MGDILSLAIPLSAIVLGMGLSFWSVYWKHQQRRLQYQERQLMIEKGMVPPPELVDEDDRRRWVGRSPQDCLRRGTVLLSLGLGLGLASVVLANFAEDRELVWIAGVAAAIVGSLGIGNLAYYFIAREKPKDSTQPL